MRNTETDGSIVSPASACGIVGFKPTLGLIGQAGIIPITHWQDTAGPMARSVRDCALLLGVVSEKTQDYTGNLDETDLKGVRLGFLRHLNGGNEQIQTLTTTALGVLRQLGAEIIEVELPHAREISQARFRAMLGEYREDLNAYLAGTTSEVRSIADLIAFNESHRDQEMLFSTAWTAGNDAASFGGWRRNR
jgi:amidase